MRHAMVILLVLSLGGHALHAQLAVTGERVRITSVHYALKGRVARVLSERADTIVVRFNEFRTVRYRQVLTDDTLTLARNAIDRLEVSRSGGHQTTRGALIGLGIGAGVGLVVGFASYKECHPQGAFDMSCLLQPASAGHSAVLGATAGGILGAAVGALVGTMSRRDRWVTVSARGLGLAISF